MWKDTPKGPIIVVVVLLLVAALALWARTL